MQPGKPCWHARFAGRPAGARPARQSRLRLRLRASAAEALAPCLARTRRAESPRCSPPSPAICRRAAAGKSMAGTAQRRREGRLRVEPDLRLDCSLQTPLAAANALLRRMPDAPRRRGGRAGRGDADRGALEREAHLPFGLSLSKPLTSFNPLQEEKPFDKLRANGVHQVPTTQGLDVKSPHTIRSRRDPPNSRPCRGRSRRGSPPPRSASHIWRACSRAGARPGAAAARRGRRQQAVVHAQARMVCGWKASIRSMLS